MFAKLIAFAKSTMSEPDGTGSASRVLAAVAIAANIIWVSYLVITTHALPDLTGSAMYLGASFSGYAANKITGCFKKDQ
jgi:uncharacterized membrane protein